MKKTNLTIRLKKALIALGWPVYPGMGKKDYTQTYKNCVNHVFLGEAATPKKITIDMFIPVVPYHQIESLMTEEQYTQFCKFMEGQTSIQGGVFVDDLERFLKQLPIID